MKFLYATLIIVNFVCVCYASLGVGTFARLGNRRMVWTGILLIALLIGLGGLLGMLLSAELRNG